MANYGLYANVDTDSLKSAVSSIKNDVSSRYSSITNLNNSLSDSIWKSQAKTTLKDGLNRISEEVITEINSGLDSLVTIAGYIASYKTAEQNALSIKNALANINDNDDNAAIIANLQNDLNSAERDMDRFESQVRGML